MRNYVLFGLLFSLFSLNAQNYSENNINKLKKFNINTQKLDLTDFDIQKDLNKILRVDRKRKMNRTFGIILSAISISTLTIGGLLIYKVKYNHGNGPDFTTPTAGLFITSGVVYGGASIPFWILSKKRKKERDRLIKNFNY